MSWGGGASRNKVRPVPRDERAWNPANLAASLESVYQRFETHARGWRSGTKRRKRGLAPRKATQASFTF